jgi:UDP-N-acetylglucosamine--N-acetylmuramyl-(pentapeptide) pyrophosphoryl-undecaprenol N-acetylglucosamine transferase
VKAERRPRVLFAGGGTGGHLYPGLALARAFAAREGGADVFFIGARRGVEAQVLPDRGVPHELLPFEPIRRSRPWQNWRLLPASGRVLLGIRRVFRSFEPDLVVGTGGYAGGPVVAWGIALGVPTAVQEQNSYPGLTTRWLAPRVRQLHLAFPEALPYLKPGPRTEVFALGNPIEPPDASLDRAAARARFSLGPGLVILVIGGSQGARALNEALLADLAGLTGDGATRPRREMQVLWATGPAHHERIAAEVQRRGLGDWVRPVPYIREMPAALAAADLAVSRAGAMALAELCAWGIPSILVPFPYAAANHQYHNARALSDAGAAVTIPESELSPGRLGAEIEALANDADRRAKIAARAKLRGHPNAADEIVAKLAMLL